MEIYEYESGLIDSKMYILLEQYSALVIDPCINDQAFSMLEEQKIQDVQVILTHEHYDHISGVNEFKQRFACSVLCSECCAENVQDTIKNASKYFMIALMNQKLSPEKYCKRFDYVCEATDTFSCKMTFTWMGHSCILRETPGHSPGSACLLIDSRILFSGDTLIKGQKIITRLPGGDEYAYQMETKPFLDSLSPEVIVYPGHGEGGTLEELLDILEHLE